MWHIPKESISEECYKAFNEMKPPIQTVNSFMERDTRELSMITKIPQEYLDELKNKYMLQIKDLSQDAVSYVEEFKQGVCFLSTSSKILDSLLGNGLMSGELYLLTGVPDCGKSQLCMSIACEVCSQKNGVVYIDIGGNFSSNRFYELILEKQVPEENYSHLLKKFTLYRASSFTSLLSLLESFCEQSSSLLQSNCRCIIIDSITMLITQMINSNHNVNSQISYLLRLLRSIARRYFLSIIITNNTMTSKEPTKLNPVYFNYFEPFVDTSIVMFKQKNESNVRSNVLKVIKSNHINIPASCTFSITSKGIVFST